MDDFLVYTERMLQIGDYVPLNEQANAGRKTNKVHWQQAAVQSIWLDCVNNDESLQTFCRRVNVSLNKGRQLNKHFASIHKKELGGSISYSGTFNVFNF